MTKEPIFPKQFKFKEVQKKLVSYWEEHKILSLICIQEVAGSIPAGSTYG